MEKKREKRAGGNGNRDNDEQTNRCWSKLYDLGDCTITINFLGHMHGVIDAKQQSTLRLQIYSSQYRN